MEHIQLYCPRHRTKVERKETVCADEDVIVKFYCKECDRHWIFL